MKHVQPIFHYLKKKQKITNILDVFTIFDYFRFQKLKNVKYTIQHKCLEFTINYNDTR
jgi:hypothetical protein